MEEKMMSMGMNEAFMHAVTVERTAEIKSLHAKTYKNKKDPHFGFVILRVPGGWIYNFGKEQKMFIAMPDKAQVKE